MIFSSDLLKIWSFQRVRCRHMIFLILSERWYFFPKTWPFYPGQKAKDRLSQEIHGSIMHRPAEKKQETWYLGSKFGLSLNLSGWRYSKMNNLQYLVPFSPQGSCFRSNYQGCSVKKGVLRNVAKFTGKHLCEGLLGDLISLFYLHIFSSTSKKHPLGSCSLVLYSEGAQTENPH